MSNLEHILDRVAQQVDRPIVTIGNFDGVHLGHQTICQEVQQSARRAGVASVALTFDPHPVVFFGKKDTSTFCIDRPDKKLELLHKHGIDHPTALPFDADLASHSPEGFVHKILFESLRAQEVWVGYDFNFGKGRSGGIEELQRHGRERDIDVRVHAAVTSGDEVVSSTRVRKALSGGNLDLAAALLNRRHALRGEVEHGEARGRALGFPTANISPRAGMMIPHGVYITTLTLLDPGAGLPAGPLPAITNVGVRPTVATAAAPNAETFVLSGLAPDADIYGQRVEVELIAFVRPEMKFDGLDALKARIAEDIAQARLAHGLGR